MQSLRGWNPQKYKPNHASNNSRAQEQWKCHHVSREDDAWNEQEKRVLKNSANRHVDKIWMWQERNNKKNDNKTKYRENMRPSKMLASPEMHKIGPHITNTCRRKSCSAGHVTKQYLWMPRDMKRKRNTQKRQIQISLKNEAVQNVWHPLAMLKIGLNSTNKLMS